MSAEGTHAGAVDRALLEDWPGRFRYPGVLIALTAGPEEPWDAAELARSVLARIGGRPPRVVCTELIEQGEFDAAEYLLAGCPELRGHEAGALGRRLRAARSAAEEDVRQRVAALRRRATAAGVAPQEVDTVELAARARRRTAAVDGELARAGRAVEERLAPVERELRDLFARQAGDGSPAAGAGGGRVGALLDAGELVAARTLMQREPIGSPIPESAARPPLWDDRWDPEDVLEYHLNPSAARPPEFATWACADDGGAALLAAYDLLNRDDSAAAAEAFADAFGRFLGAEGGGAVAHRVPGTRFHLTYFDGLFGGEGLSGLHPTGRVDLYVGGPGAQALPPGLAGQAPHVAVAPGLAAQEYTDRQATAVLSLRDLLRLVVLHRDRPAAALAVVARQWPVSALVGRRAADLAGVLGQEPAAAWRTLRWIAHLSLGYGPDAAQAMENCTAMDPGSLGVMLRYAEHLAADSGSGPWSAEGSGWQRDAALVHALREELVGRCGSPEAEAAWWAALAACDPADGQLSRENLLLTVELYADRPEAPRRVAGGLRELVAAGLLAADEGVGGEERLRVPLSGIARMLRADADQQVAGALARLRPSGAPRSGGDAEEGAAGEEALSVWERNRFATVPSAARYGEAEAAGADRGALAALRAEAERELHGQDPEELVPDGRAPGTELAPLLSALEAQCRARYPGIRMDVRCPSALRAGVPGPVLRAVLFEVLDNAGRAAAAVEGGLVQVVATSESPEALVEVQDSGSGLPAASRGRRVFALSAAGRQEGRSGGLHRARRFLRAFATPSVEAELEVFQSSHPTLTGAALRLVLPEHPGGT